jgi:hypothetical protein
VTAVQEHYDRVDAIREENRLYEESVMRAKQEKQTQTRRPLPFMGPQKKSLTALPSQAQQSGQNHQQHRA